MEYFVVTCSQIENAFVKGSDVFDGVGVRRRPFVVIELVVEDFTVEKTTHQDSFFYKNIDIFQKQKRADVVVLVLHDVFDDVTYSSNLIIF